PRRASLGAPPRRRDARLRGGPLPRARRARRRRRRPPRGLRERPLPPPRRRGGGGRRPRSPVRGGLRGARVLRVARPDATGAPSLGGRARLRRPVAATFDLVTVGGGLGGAALARAMAERGASVLVVERERRFVDRVRGEVLMPWGVGEARALGLDVLLRETCAHPLPWSDLVFGGVPVVHRDLAATTSQGVAWFSFYHPAMQEVLLDAAAAAGATVRRGARVRDVRPGSAPVAVVEEDGGAEEIRARLVVAADGRRSVVRRWGGFAVRRDPERLLFAGVLLDDVPAPDDTGIVFFNPAIGRISLFFPQGGGRVRAYVGYHPDAGPPPAGAQDFRRFTEESCRTGVDAAWFEQARPGC